jgi:proliferating cell nuclear antigen PCNA
MAYEQKLDVKLFSESVDVGDCTLIVEVYQYNGNEPKVQIGRMSEDRHLKLGRLTLEEVNAVIPLLEKAGNSINEGKEAEKEESEEDSPSPVPKKKKSKNEKDTLPDFKIVLADPLLLKNSITIIKKSLNEAMVKVNKDMLQISGIEPANVAMVVYKLLNSACVEWDVPKEFNVVLNLNNLDELLKECKKDDVMVITKKDDTNLELQYKNKTTRKFTLPAIELHEEEIKIPELKFDCRINMPTKMFHQGVKSLQKVTESVELVAEKNKFTLSAPNNVNNGTVEIAKGDDVRITTKEDKIQSRYSVEYLLAFLGKSCKNCLAHKVKDDITIEFSKDYPIFISLTDIDKVKLQYLLAPRVAN